MLHTNPTRKRGKSLSGPRSGALKLRFSSTTTRLAGLPPWSHVWKTRKPLRVRFGAPAGLAPVERCLVRETALDGGKLRRGDECAKNSEFWLSKHASTRASRVVGRKSATSKLARRVSVGL